MKNAYRSRKFFSFCSTELFYEAYNYHLDEIGMIGYGSMFEWGALLEALGGRFEHPRSLWAIDLCDDFFELDRASQCANVFSLIKNNLDALFSRIRAEARSIVNCYKYGVDLAASLFYAYIRDVYVGEWLDRLLERRDRELSREEDSDD